MGHRKIARISGNLTIGQQARYVQERNLGYQRTLEKAGISFDPKLLVDSAFSTEGGYLGTKELLNRKTPFTAILVGNDQMAIGAYSALNEAGLKIPEDVSIIGHDDNEFTRYLFPPLTTIKPSPDVGMVLGELCLALYRNPQQTLKRSLTPELVVRSSVAKIS